MRNHTCKLAFSLVIVGSVGCSGEDPVLTEHAGNELEFIGKTRETHRMAEESQLDPSTGEPVGPVTLDDDQPGIRDGGAYLDIGDGLEYYAAPDPVRAARKRAEYNMLFPESGGAEAIATRQQAIVLGSDSRVARNEN